MRYFVSSKGNYHKVKGWHGPTWKLYSTHENYAAACRRCSFLNKTHQFKIDADKHNMTVRFNRDKIDVYHDNVVVFTGRLKECREFFDGYVTLKKLHRLRGGE